MSVLGSAAEPVVIVATGNIKLDAASVRIYGLIYSQAADWDNDGLGDVWVQGAAVAEGNFSGDGTTEDLVRPDHPQPPETEYRFVRARAGQLEGLPVRRTTRHSRGSATQRGVSMVEAIVAMAVMAFGMMAIVGLQSTLRLNSDVAKQRSEAVRIAEEAIEDWRAFSAMPTTAGLKAYDDITVGALDDIAVVRANATYTLKQTVSPGSGLEVDSSRGCPGSIAPARRRASR